MKKTEMLKKNYEFSSVLKKGKFYNGKLIDMVILKNNLSINLLGLAISKKAGNSVKRNKIKRIVREIYKNFEKDISVGNSIVILWKKDAKYEDLNFYEIENDFKNILNKAKI